MNNHGLQNHQFYIYIILFKNQRSWWLSHHAISRVANIFTSLYIYKYN